MVAKDKVVSAEVLAQRVRRLKSSGARVVFTNGVFDLLHVGHVRYIEEARALGDALVVAVNSDRSARRLGKGPGRPFNDENARAEVIAALAAVDYVTVFDNDTPYELIRLIEPDVLVKGGDWPAEEIVGADIVHARGGDVRALPFVAGYATSALIARIKSEGEADGPGPEKI